MGNLTLLIAAAVFCFIIVYMLFKLKETSTDDDAGNHAIRILLVALLIGGFLVMGKIGLDDYNNCSWQVANTTITGTTTTYDWSYTCSTNANTTANTFYQIIVWFARFIGLYLFFYIIVVAYGYVKEIIKKGVRFGK